MKPVEETEDNTQGRVQQMLEKLAEHNFRITPQRMEVLRVLAKSAGHPSAEDIHQQVRKKFPSVSLGTVYKTISLLKDLGEVLELGFGEGGNRYDGHKPYSHPHVICTRCGEILDPDVSLLRDMEEEIARETGFRIFSHRLDFFGLCPRCRKEPE